MDDLDWCRKQKKGIRKIEPSMIVAKDYLRKADESLQVMESSPSTEWKVVAAYYACYDAIYSLLQMAGIKSEIHECTISLMKYFGFSAEQIRFMEDLKTDRHNAQYYTDRKYSLPDTRKVKGFVLDCREKFSSVDFEKIQKEIFDSK